MRHEVGGGHEDEQVAGSGLAAEAIETSDLISIRMSLEPAAAWPQRPLRLRRLGVHLAGETGSGLAAEAIETGTYMFRYLPEAGSGLAAEAIETLGLPVTVEVELPAAAWPQRPLRRYFYGLWRRVVPAAAWPQRPLRLSEAEQTAGMVAGRRGH